MKSCPAASSLELWQRRRSSEQRLLDYAASPCEASRRVRAQSISRSRAAVVHLIRHGGKPLSSWRKASQGQWRAIMPPPCQCFPPVTEDFEVGYGSKCGLAFFSSAPMTSLSSLCCENPGLLQCSHVSPRLLQTSRAARASAKDWQRAPRPERGHMELRSL